MIQTCRPLKIQRRGQKSGQKTRKGAEILLTVHITANDPDVSAAINLDDPIPLYRKAGIWLASSRSTRVLCTRLGGWRTVVAASPSDMDVTHLNHLTTDLVTQVVSGLRPCIVVRDVVNSLRTIRMDMLQVVSIEVNRGLISASGSLRPYEKLWLIGRTALAVVMGLPGLTPLLGRIADEDEPQTLVTIHLERIAVGRSVAIARYRSLLDIPSRDVGDPAQVDLTKGLSGAKLKQGQTVVEGPEGSDFTLVTSRKTVVLPEAELDNKLLRFEGRAASQIVAAVSTNGGAIARTVQEQVARMVETRLTQERSLTTSTLKEIGTSLYHDLSKSYVDKVDDLAYQNQLQGAELIRLQDLLAQTTAQSSRAELSSEAVGRQVLVLDEIVSTLKDTQV